LDKVEFQEVANFLEDIHVAVSATENEKSVQIRVIRGYFSGQVASFPS
jgi:hypothetical protein